MVDVMSRQSLVAGLACAALVLASCSSSSGPAEELTVAADPTTSTTEVTNQADDRPAGDRGSSSTVPRSSTTEDPGPVTSTSSVASTTSTTGGTAVEDDDGSAGAGSTPAATSPTTPKPPPVPPRETTPAPTTPPRPASGGLSAAPASGPLIDGSAPPIARPAILVKIDNSGPARPQNGINQADMLIEVQVEGTSRLVAVYQSEDAPVVGPVRSARTTDLNLFGLLGTPLFSSSGGNRGVRNAVAASDVIDVSEPVARRAYSRTRSRKVPHNLMSSTSNLWGSAPEATTSPAPIFDYRSVTDEPPAGSEPVSGVNVRFDNSLTVQFTWDAASQRWLRFQGGRAHTDTAGVQVSPTSLVVLETPYAPSWVDARSPEAQTIGSGLAHVFTGGQKVSGVWVRNSLAAPFTLTDKTGAPMTLVPGRVMVELAHPGRCIIDPGTPTQAPCWVP